MATLKNKELKMNGKNICNICGKIKKLSEFHRGKDRYTNVCSKCHHDKYYGIKNDEITLNSKKLEAAKKVHEAQEKALRERIDGKVKRYDEGEYIKLTLDDIAIYCATHHISYGDFMTGKR